MRSPSGFATSIAWSAACSRLLTRGVGGVPPTTSPGDSGAASSSTSISPVPPLTSQARVRQRSRSVPCNKTACGTEDGLVLELEAERSGLHRGWLLGDQIVLNIGGLVALGIIAIGGVYRYRQHRASAPPPQVLGRLLEEEEQGATEMTGNPEI
mmetsp:Transcript_45528/g.103425  ORF Transcript_45528/g.103425 Transcript_45528/m.103425 type:complete len:154 (-) Transcript_45528:28-489(-)